jgi:hypothetical protein
MDAQQGKMKLEATIEAGRVSAMGLIERLHNEMPEDQLAKGAALRFGTRAPQQPTNLRALPGTATVDNRDALPELVMGVGDKGLLIHKHALSQLASRAGVPGAYMADLAHGVEWQRKLAAGILNEHYHQGTPDSRYLVRSVKGTARGVMSDKYRRLDNRPIVDALAHAAQAIGAQPYSGTFSDVRVALKLIIPRVYIAGGDIVAFGLEWGNSDFGASKNYLRAFFLRLECLNGAKSDNALAQVHLGRGISDDIELSTRTMALDTATTVSAMSDVVKMLLSPAKIEERIAQVEKAAAEGATRTTLRAQLGKRVTKGEAERIVAAFESNDVVNLPPGDTQWRASNAVSWIAGQKDVEADRRLDLERIAGEFITGTREREDFAEAA